MTLLLRTRKKQKDEDIWLKWPRHDRKSLKVRFNYVLIIRRNGDCCRTLL